MAWNDTPKSANLISDSQAPIQLNFADFATAFAIDHYSINNAQQGLHKKMSMPRQDAAPANALITSNVIAFYERLTTLQVPLIQFDELYVKTSSGERSFTDTNDFTRQLASSIIIKNGRHLIASLATGAHNYPITFNTDFTSIPYAILLNLISSGDRNLNVNYVCLSYSNVTTTGFRLNVQKVGPTTFQNISVYYMALGV